MKPIVVSPKVFYDTRGYLFESYRQDRFEKEVGSNINFVQENESKSTFGVIRGLHFQKPPFEQSKLVRVVFGKILDVAVDIRKGSSNFGKSFSFELSGENKKQLFIPRGFAHGFLTVNDVAIVHYKVDNYYSPEHDSGIIWNDNTLDIDWHLQEYKIEKPIVSSKDNNLQSFNML